MTASPTYNRAMVECFKAMVYSTDSAKDTLLKATESPTEDSLSRAVKKAQGQLSASLNRVAHSKVVLGLSAEGQRDVRKHFVQAVEDTLIFEVVSIKQFFDDLQEARNFFVTEVRRHNNAAKLRTNPHNGFNLEEEYQIFTSKQEKEMTTSKKTKTVKRVKSKAKKKPDQEDVPKKSLMERLHAFDEAHGDTFGIVEGQKVYSNIYKEPKKFFKLDRSFTDSAKDNGYEIKARGVGMKRTLVRSVLSTVSFCFHTIMAPIDIVSGTVEISTNGVVNGTMAIKESAFASSDDGEEEQAVTA